MYRITDHHSYQSAIDNFLPCSLMEYAYSNDAIAEICCPPQGVTYSTCLIFREETIRHLWKLPMTVSVPPSAGLEIVENGIGNTLNPHNKLKSEGWTMGRLIECDERGLGSSS